MSVAVVTDSTADLPADLCAVRGIAVVPLTVVIDGVEGQEGCDVMPGDVARALTAGRATVTTSRPTPEAFATAYRAGLDGGADSVVSVHISAELSGTVKAAGLAAREFGDRVRVIDARGAGMGTGFVALAAAEAAAEGRNVEGVYAAAVDAIRRIDTYFYVDTLEYLRRGGRIGTPSALLGTALSVKPILHVVDGAVVVRDRVRTAGRALARLLDLAAGAVGQREADIAVHHLASPRRAADLAGALAARLGGRLRDRYVLETGASVAAHVGPGTIGVVIHRRAEPAPSRA